MSPSFVPRHCAFSSIPSSTPKPCRHTIHRTLPSPSVSRVSLSSSIFSLKFLSVKIQSAAFTIQLITCLILTKEQRWMRKNCPRMLAKDQDLVLKIYRLNDKIDRFFFPMRRFNAFRVNFEFDEEFYQRYEKSQVFDVPGNSWMVRLEGKHVQDPKLVNLADFAVKEHNRRNGKNMELVEVVKAMKQLVCGWMYYLTIRMKDADKVEIYQAKVLDDYFGARKPRMVPLIFRKDPSLAFSEVESRRKHKSTYNYGVMVLSAYGGNDYYGTLQQIVEIYYYGDATIYKAVLFKCHW